MRHIIRARRVLVLLLQVTALVLLVLFASTFGTRWTLLAAGLAVALVGIALDGDLS